jgi:hypothetical protein
VVILVNTLMVYGADEIDAYVFLSFFRRSGSILPLVVDASPTLPPNFLGATR